MRTLKLIFASSFLLSAATAFANLSATPNPSASGNYTVSWPAVSGAVSYQLKESTDGGSTYSATYQTSNLSYSITGKPDDVYTYRLFYCFVEHWIGLICVPSLYPLYDVQVSASGGIATGGTIGGPDSDYNGTYTLSWGAISGATTFDLRENGSSSFVYSGTATSFSNLNQPTGTYTYEVRGCSSGVCGPWGPVKTVNNQDLPGVSESEYLIASAALAGGMEYSAGVDDRGQAQISIPINAMPGVRGHQPSVSISYNSGGSRKLIDDTKIASPIGYGWSISGIPTVRRCRVGTGGALQLNDSDRLCYNDEVLFLESGSSYWADNAVYGVNRNSSIKVIAKGTLNSSVQHRRFEVYLPDGRLQKFGDGSSRRISPSNSTIVYDWKLYRDTDDYGNNIDYFWLNNTVDGSSVPYYMSYANSRIRFFYTEREDAEDVNLGAQNVPGVSRQPLILRAAFTEYYTGSAYQWVNLWRVDTELDSSNTYRRMERIQRCGYLEAGGGGVSCQSPLEFTWQTGSNPEEEFNNTITKVEDGLGRWDEFDYELLPGTGTHTLETGTCEVCWETGDPQPVFASTTSSGRLVTKEHRRNPVASGFAARKTTFEYTGNAYYGSFGEGFAGFKSVARTQHDLPIHNVSSGANTTHDVTSYGKYWVGTPHYGKSLTDRIVESSSQGTLSKQRWDWGLVFAGGSWNRIVENVWVREYEDNQLIRTQDIEYDYCLRPLVGGNCPTSGTNTQFYQSDVTQRVGTGLSGSVTPDTAVWGSYVGDHSITGEVRSEQTVTDYLNDTSNWVIGFTERIETTSDTPSTSPVVQSAEFSRDGTKASVASIESFPLDSSLELLTNISYTSNGSISSISTQGVDVPVRTVSRSAYTFSRYPTVVTDPFGEDIDLAYDLRFGSPKTVTNPDGQSAEFEFDRLGRVELIESATGDVTALVRTNCNVTSLCNGINWATPSHVLQRTVTNGVQVQPDTRTFFDVDGRVLAEDVQAYESADGWRRTEYRYDAWGRLQSQSLPYHLSTGTPKYTVTRYDEQSRAVRSERPDGGWTKTIYTKDGAYLVALVNDYVLTPGSSAENQQRLLTYNAAGQLIQSRDAHHQSSEAVQTNYSYGSLGLLKTVSVGGIQVASLSYDAAGNRTQIVEPSTGTTTFDFDALGQLLSSTDAKSQTTEYDYDFLGRLTEQREGCSPCTETRTWTYDPVNGYGRMATSDSDVLSQTYSYLSSGQLNTISSTIELSSFPQASGFSRSTPRVVDYDYTNGRLSQVSYPSGPSVNIEYQNGYRKRTLAGTTAVDTIDSRNAAGLVTDRSFANGLQTELLFDTESYRLTSINTGTSGNPDSVQDLTYTWRTNSSLKSRVDQHLSNTRTETFGYDAVNRLLTAQESYHNRILTFDYDDFGNLTQKISNRSGDLDVTGYSYTSPHRLNSVTAGGLSTSFVYDSNGNITKINPSGTTYDSNFTYDAGNRLTKITNDPSGSSEVNEEFWYGADGQRAFRKATWKDGSSTDTSWTFYLEGGVYEEVWPLHDTSTTWLRKVQITSGVLQRTREPSSGPEITSFEYLHRDHLGSVDTVTSSTGAILHRMAYDPYGGRRQSAWNRDIQAADLDALLADSDESTSRGYTDHEMLDRSGFIHMNGRVFSPKIGRFLQPDPFVQSPTYSQSYNRYAYTMGNPVSYTDPSGFSCLPGMGYGENDLPAPVCVNVPHAPQGLPFPVIGGYSGGQGNPYDLSRFIGNNDIVLDVLDTGNEVLDHIDDAVPPDLIIDEVIGVGRGVLDATEAVTKGEYREAAIVVAGVLVGRRLPKLPKAIGGIETRGVRPNPGERTIQGQVEAAVEKEGGNPTVIRGNQELFRLRARRHGRNDASRTPLNDRHVTPDGRVFMKPGSDGSVTPREMRELYKAQNGHGSSVLRTRGGK